MFYVKSHLDLVAYRRFRIFKGEESARQTLITNDREEGEHSFPQDAERKDRCSWKILTTRDAANQNATLTSLERVRYTFHHTWLSLRKEV